MDRVLQGCVGCGSSDDEPGEQPPYCQEALEHAGCLNTVNVINCRK